jgi:16S rRNA (uracil1498-N3)-methyltransferase
MRRYFLPETMLPQQELSLRDHQAFHAHSVVRLRPGTHIVLFDGHGREFEACVLETREQEVRVRVIAECACRADPPIYVAVAQGFLKEAKTDVTVRQLTELGVSLIVPFGAARSIGKRDRQWLTGRHERWRRIAREAMKSSGRSREPEIRPAASLSEVLQLSQDFDLRLVFWERLAPVGPPPPEPDGGRFRRIFALLGPEGGLAEDEVEAARAAGFTLASLGPRILRADTAALAAATLVQLRFGDMRSQAPDS